MTSKTDVLIFAEDPGAANYVRLLPEALAQRGQTAILLAGGSAQAFLLEQGMRPTTVPPSMTGESILARFNPRLVLVGTSENEATLGFELITSARRMGIVSIGFVDFSSNADQRFRGRGETALAYAPDWLLVPDTLTKNAYISLGYPESRAVVCGHPHYDHVLNVKRQLDQEARNLLRQRVLPQAPDGRPVVVFAAEISTGLNPQQYRRSAEYTLTGWGSSTGRTEIVIEEFIAAVQLVNPRPYLVLRLHPKNALHEFAAYLDSFDLVSQGGSPLELVFLADLVVGLTSMVLLEATLLNKLTLSIVPRAIEKQWLPNICIETTMCVTTRAQLRYSLAKLLAQSATAPTFFGGTVVSDSLCRVLGFIETRLNESGKHALAHEKALEDEK